MLMMEFTILHTNDLHSDFASMPRIRSFFQAYERKHPPERLLRFDIGDHMDRMRVETEGTLGAANIDVMNATGYDAAVPGNNEGLTFPREVLDDLYGRRADFPVIATNLLRSGTEGSGQTREWNRSHLVLERGGVRFGLVGLTAAFNAFYQELGWEATDPFAAAAAEVKLLREERQADIVIVLSHLGINHDLRMAEEVQGIDLILGGHTHHLIDELKQVRSTYIGAAGKSGTHVGVVTLVFDETSRRVVSCTGGARSIAGVEPERELAAMIEARAAKAEESMNREIARLNRPLSSDYARESPLGNLLAASLRRHCGADIGIVNAGQLLGGLEAGSVTMRRLHAICPSPINPCSMLLRGDRLLTAIEQSLNLSYINRKIFGYGFRGEYLGTLCLDGVTVELEGEANAMEGEPRRLASVTVRGEPLQRDRLYRVGTIDMFTFKVGYESLSEGEQLHFYLPEFLRDLLTETLASPESERWIEEAFEHRFLDAGNRLD